MRTIITVDSMNHPDGDTRELEITIPQQIGKSPEMCFVKFSNSVETIQIDPHELIEVGEIIKRLYR